MDHPNSFLPYRAPMQFRLGICALVVTGSLLLGSCASAPDYPAGWAQAADAQEGCPDVSGEYSNRGVDSQGDEANLSALFGLGQVASRVILQKRADSMRVTTYTVDTATNDLLIPSADLGCGGGAVTYEYPSRTGAEYRYEGAPHSSLTRELAVSKGSDGALLVRHASADTWIAPVLWGEARLHFWNHNWARFEPVKPEPAARRQ